MHIDTNLKGVWMNVHPPNSLRQNPFARSVSKLLLLARLAEWL
jgi:hypothetical protein